MLLAAALLPAIVLLVYVYSKDRVEREPMKLVLRIFALGALAGPIAGIAEGALFSVFEAIIPAGVVLLVFEYFIGVAAVEEGLKYLFLSMIRKNPEFNYIFDGIVYGVAVSLGFAALESILYVFLMGGMQTAIQRAIFSVPGHCAYGVIMGCFFGVARHREIAGNAKEAKMYYWFAFLLPVVGHGFYDAALSSENGTMALVALAVQISIIIAAMILVHKQSQIDQAIYPHGMQPSEQVQQAMQAPQGMGQQPYASTAPTMQPQVQAQQVPQGMAQPYVQPPMQQYAPAPVQQMPMQQYAQAPVQQAPTQWPQSQAPMQQGLGQPPAQPLIQQHAQAPAQQPPMPTQQTQMPMQYSQMPQQMQVPARQAYASPAPSMQPQPQMPQQSQMPVRPDASQDLQ